MIHLKEPVHIRKLPKVADIKEHTIYEVEVSCFKGNPWFIAYLIVGFMDKREKKFGSYTKLIDEFAEELDIKTTAVAAYKELTRTNKETTTKHDFM